jgi:hypothetical protein
MSTETTQGLLREALKKHLPIKSDLVGWFGMCAYCTDGAGGPYDFETSDEWVDHIIAVTAQISPRAAEIVEAALNAPPAPTPRDDEAALSVMPDDVCPDCTLGPPNWAERKEGHCPTCNDTGDRPAPKDALREALERLVAWDAKHPKTFVMNEYRLRECETELDEICMAARAALEASRGVTK